MNIDLKEMLFKYKEDRDRVINPRVDSWWKKDSGISKVSIDQLNNRAALIYAAIALLPLIYFVGTQNSWSAWFSSSSWWVRVLILALWTLVALLPNAWLWVHSSAFLEWATVRYKDCPGLKAIEAERFKLHAEFAKSLWAGVLALYGASILGLK